MLKILIAYAYPAMIPIALVEGPLVAFAGGVGFALGRINPLVVYAIVMLGALVQDVAYYWLGRCAMASPRAHTVLCRLTLIRKSMDVLREAWGERMFATLVASKFTYGLYAPIIVTAGMARAPWWKFLGESLALSAVVLAGWLGAGIGAGHAYGALGRTATWVSIGLAIVAIAGLWAVGRHARARLNLRPLASAARRGPPPNSPAAARPETR
jgi:membrane protein DedA with SNARE-associated domain